MEEGNAIEALYNKISEIQFKNATNVLVCAKETEFEFLLNETRLFQNLNTVLLDNTSEEQLHGKAADLVVVFRWECKNNAKLEWAIDVAEDRIFYFGKNLQNIDTLDADAFHKWLDVQISRTINEAVSRLLLSGDWDFCKKAVQHYYDIYTYPRGLYTAIAKKLFQSRGVSIHELTKLISLDEQSHRMSIQDKDYAQKIRVLCLNSDRIHMKQTKKAKPQKKLAIQSIVKKKFHLGINPNGHDTGLAVLDDAGRPIAIYEESKFNGLKCAYDHLPFAIRQLLKDEFTHFESLSWVVDENYFQFLNKNPEGLFCLPELNGLSSLLKQYFSWKEENIVPHHEAHLQSAFRCSGFDKSLVMSCDGDGGIYSIRIALGNLEQDNDLKIVENCKSDFSFGALFNVLTSFLGYRNEHPLVHAGKIMGLSAYGNPIYLDELASLFPVSSNALFPSGNPRRIYWPSVFKCPPFRYVGNNFSQKQADIAASMQLFVEKEVLRILQTLCSRYPDYDYLCLAGGVSLNSLMNGKILRSGFFKDIFVQPQASDCGLATGTVLHTLAKKKKRLGFKWEHAYWGFREKDDIQALTDLLETHDLPVRVTKMKNPSRETAQKIIGGKIVAVFRQAEEVGPRSLGNRSILCLPSSEMRDKVNDNVKFRERWRPFAPIVLEDSIGEYFESNRPEPFMTVVYDVKPEWRSTLDGITHFDGSSRVQSVNEFQNPFLFDLLKEMKQGGSAPVILNTSFNINGQPIVRTVYDAVITFLSSDIDCLIIDGHLILKDKTKEQFPSSSLYAGDRSLAPYVQKASKISVALLPGNRDTLEQLNALLSFPSIRHRKDNSSFSLANLYVNAPPFSFDEVLSIYSDKFASVEALDRKRIKDRSEILVVLTGSNPVHATSFQDIHLCRGNKHPGTIRPDQNTIIQLLDHIDFSGNSEYIFLADSQWRVIPGDYFLEVCLAQTDFPY